MANPNKNARDRRTFPIAFRVPSTAASFAFKVFKARKRSVIEYVEFIPEATLATDGANYFTATVKNGSATPVAALVNTNAAGGAALTANTIYGGTNGTKAVRTLAPGDQVTLDAVKTGTQTLPAGTLVLWVTETN